MNKVYRSAWNESTRTWVAAQENASEQTKSSGAGKGAVIAAVIGLAGFSVSSDASAYAFVGYEYNGKDYCSSSANTPFWSGCAMWGSGVTNFTGPDIAYLAGAKDITKGGVWAANNNAGLWFGGGPTGTASGTSRIVVDAGGATIQGGTIDLLSTAGVNVSNKKVLNVAAGTVSATSTDAVNGSQLYAIANGNAGTKYFHTNSAKADSVAAATDSVAIGPHGYVDVAATNGIAVGSEAWVQASSVNGVAISSGAKSNGQSAIAIGNSAAATADWTVAMGSAASAKGAGDVALGASSQAYGGTGANYSTAVGANAQAIAANTGAFGAGAKATASNSVAIGSNSTGDRANTVAVGSASQQRQITYVAKGTADMDAVNLAQLKAAGVNVDTSGNLTNAFVAYDDTTKGKVTLAGGTAGTTITNVKAGAVSATSTDAINGSQMYSLASSETKAFGGSSTVNPNGSISMPEYTVGGDTVEGVDGAVTALDTRITDMTSLVTDIAPKLKYIKFGETIALDATAAGTDSVAIGGFAQAMGDGALAIGANARALGTNSVAIGYGSSTAQANTFAVGSTTSKRRIVNVADGTNISDAVTVGQMNTAINTAITNAGVKNNGMLGASAALPVVISRETRDQPIAALSTPTDMPGKINADGTADVTAAYDRNADGSINYGSLTMGDNVAGGATIHNVTAGADGINTVNTDQMNSAIANVTAIANDARNPMFAANGSRETEAAVASGNYATAMGANAKASSDNSVALGANSVADRANTVSVGTAGRERQIVNVAAGTQATDAVNVEQLNATVSNAVGSLPAGMTAKDYTDARFNSMQNSVNQVAKDAYAGIAAAMAMPNLAPSEPGKTVVAAGSGVYKSGTAAAVGVTYRSRSGKWLTNGAASVTSTGDVGARVQVGYEF
ncbi:MAG TPA: YadA-like family protein [Paraburkholderia sp.]